MSPDPAPAPPVLVLRALGLGDALTGVPALRGLRRLHPDRRLLLAAPEGVGGWLASLGVVDGVVPTGGLHDAPPGAGLGPHDAVDLHGRGPRSHRLLLAAAPRSLLAFGVPGLHEGPTWCAEEHEVLRWCRLVADVGGVCGPQDLRLPEVGRPAPGAPGSSALLLHPGAASASRRWPVPRWAAVARALHQRGERVLVTGGAGERDLAEQVARLAGLPGGAVVAGRTDLAGLACLVAGARALVCGDTGVAHLATAVGTSSVLLFGPVAPQRWGPLVDVDRHVVLWHGDGGGDPHGDEPDPALLSIDVAAVLDAVSGLLAH